MMQRSNNKGRSRNQRRKRIGDMGNAGVFRHPPMIRPQIQHNQRMRFTCTGAVANFAITYVDLLDTILISTTAILGYDLFDQVKVNFVEMWAAPAQGAAPQQLAIEWAGENLGAVGDGRVISDTSMGVEPAHIRTSPSKRSQASQWQISNGAVAFRLTTPVAAVIDVDLTFRTIQNLAPQTAQAALVGATVGELYYRGLDGAAVAGTNFPAVAPATI